MAVQASQVAAFGDVDMKALQGRRPAEGADFSPAEALPVEGFQDGTNVRFGRSSVDGVALGQTAGDRSGRRGLLAKGQDLARRRIQKNPIGALVMKKERAFRRANGIVKKSFRSSR